VVRNALALFNIGKESANAYSLVQLLPDARGTSKLRQAKRLAHLKNLFNLFNEFAQSAKGFLCLRVRGSWSK